MKKPAVKRELLHLLVSVYNKSIQTYYHFPEVILCDRQRLEPADFAQLVEEGFIGAYSFDSFGKNYCLTRKGESYLFDAIARRRHRHLHEGAMVQSRLPFTEMLA